MTRDFKVGDQVERNSEAGWVRGTIQKVVTEEVKFQSYTRQNASASNAMLNTSTFMLRIRCSVGLRTINLISDKHRASKKHIILMQ